jgi:mycofactocin precursor
MEDMEKDKRIMENGNNKEGIFSIEEIKIEEIAIDGICGVY